MTDWNAVAAFALSLPATVASTSYGRPAIKVDGRMFVSTGGEPGSFHVRATHDEKAVLIETDPATFWQTPHYADWPGLLVRHDGGDPDRVALVIRRAWWDRAKVATRATFGARP